MKIVWTALALILLISMARGLPWESRIKDFFVHEKNIYFEYAQRTANWLKSLAIETSPGVYKWPAQEDALSWCPIGIDSGAAGIGLFFLRLSQILPSSIDRKKVKGRR